MKKLLVALLFFTCVSGYAQVTPSGIIRVANSTTVFGETVPAGKNIVDNGAGKQYLVLLPLANTKTIATCTLNTDIKEVITDANAVNSLYSGLVTNATHTGDATGSTALSVVKINGTLMSGLATGILKNTTSTGVPSIAVAGTDYQAPIALTTTGTSGAASIIGNTINVPNYGSAGSTWSGMVYGTSFSSGNTTLGVTSVQYTFTGSSPATWTLSSFASPGNFFYFIKNIGSANLTVQGGGSDSLYATSKVKSFVITPGQSAVFSSASTTGFPLLWTILFQAQTSVVLFTPASSTDSTYPNGTLTSDDTYMYFRNSSGTWKKITWATF